MVLLGRPVLCEALFEKREEKCLSQKILIVKNRTPAGAIGRNNCRRRRLCSGTFCRRIIVRTRYRYSDYHTGPMNALSGGFKLRVLLAQLLFQQPDVLLLDEPTNHLDIVSILWLEKYLCSQFEGTLIFISHDRNFLNAVARIYR